MSLNLIYFTNNFGGTKLVTIKIGINKLIILHNHYLEKYEILL